MTEQELAEIEARCNAATPGPWVWDGDSPMDVEPTVCPHASRWTDHGPDLVNGDQQKVWDAYWKNDPTGESSGKPEPPTGVLVAHGYDASGLNVCAADATFIAAARSDVPRLVAEIRRLRAALPGKT
jgi:hypothetical protein